MPLALLNEFRFKIRNLFVVRLPACEKQCKGRRQINLSSTQIALPLSFAHRVRYNLGMNAENALQFVLRLLPSVVVLMLGFIAANDPKTRERWAQLMYMVGSMRADAGDDAQAKKSVRWPFFIMAALLLIWPIRYLIHATRTIEVNSTALAPQIVATPVPLAPTPIPGAVPGVTPVPGTVTAPGTAAPDASTGTVQVPTPAPPPGSAAPAPGQPGAPPVNTAPTTNQPTTNAPALQPGVPVQTAPQQPVAPPAPQAAPGQNPAPETNTAPVAPPASAPPPQAPPPTLPPPATP
jgi:hypothetical protein